MAIPFKYAGSLVHYINEHGFVIVAVCFIVSFAVYWASTHTEQ